MNYPNTCRDLHGWCVVIATKPRGHIEVDDIIDDAQLEESPFQSDELILPTMEVKEMERLVDGRVQTFEQVVDPIPESMVANDILEEFEEVVYDDNDEVKENMNDDDDDNLYDDDNDNDTNLS